MQLKETMPLKEKIQPAGERKDPKAEKLKLLFKMKLLYEMGGNKEMVEQKQALIEKFLKFNPQYQDQVEKIFKTAKEEMEKSGEADPYADNYSPHTKQDGPPFCPRCGRYHWSTENCDESAYP